MKALRRAQSGYPGGEECSAERWDVLEKMRQSVEGGDIVCLGYEASGEMTLKFSRDMTASDFRSVAPHQKFRNGELKFINWAQWMEAHSDDPRTTLSELIWR